ncbi:MAG TPA: hypothetical protein VMR43_16530 [Variovorax sp.]|nr:hypothetical protein [Variovorax sp.]
MATQKSTQGAPDRAIESLLSEIANAAYITEQRLRVTPSDSPECYEYEVYVLRDLIKKMGWMADTALKRIEKLNAVQDGDAVAWMLSPVSVEALAQEVQA